MNLNDFRVTDFITQVLATQYNRVIDSTLRGELANTETLAADKTLIDADYSLQVYDPTAARIVTLPAIAAANHPFYIINASVTYALTVKNAGGTTIGTVALSSSGNFVSDGTAWYAFGGGSVPDATSLVKGILQLAGQLGGTAALPDVRGLRETGGPTLLTLDAIADGQLLLRSGTNLVGRTPYPLNGWISDSNVWTYVSASSFSVPGDQTAIYTKGLRLKWTQTTVKYGVVLSSVLGSGVTTVTIIVNTDFTVANAVISANYYSMFDEPSGWPGWFNYTPVFGGFSADPTGVTSRFNVKGKLCFLMHDDTGNGTSNATTFTVSLAVQAAATMARIVTFGGYALDAGSALTAGPFLRINPSATAINLYPTSALGNWTATGGKRASFIISHEI